MLIGISGKKQSGKDTTGQIIQILLNSPHLSNEGVKTFLRKEVDPDKFYYPNDWKIKKFADKLKDIVCLLIGCTREQLEDEEFKNKELPEEWWYYKVKDGNGQHVLVDYINPNQNEMWIKIANPRYLIKTTPRLLLQLIGTECGRHIIHPNLWINSLFSEYVETSINYRLGFDPAIEISESDDMPVGTIESIHEQQPDKTFRVYIGSKTGIYKNGFPNWIITDMRFPNELEAVNQREGISIRVNRNWFKSELPNGSTLTLRRGFITGHDDEALGKEHISETALDDGVFNFIIDNDGTIDELIDKVRVILDVIGLLKKKE